VAFKRRQYFFPDDEVLRVDMLLRVQTFEDQAEVEAPLPLHLVAGAGVRLLRAQAALRAGRHHGRLPVRPSAAPQPRLPLRFPAKSQIRQADEHEVVFESRYLEWDILEHIRLVDQDRFRARSIYSWRDGDLELVETHHEIRLEPAGPPLPADA
jgi:hypothetical protein